jgi:2',3'-cyclic-nucleotide 2'-phosphodiesterase (5'-nucleotidase family)
MWRRAALVFALVATTVAPATVAIPTAQQPDEVGARAGAPLTILQLNDVYSTVPVDGAGGLARVATLKQQLTRDGVSPILMLAGDFLSSSVASTVFKGEQMIAALNAVGLDIATLGNHEFDFGADVLLTRMAEARWQWVIANAIDRTTGRPVGGASPYIVRTFGSLRVGIIGLCSTEGVIRDRLARIDVSDPMQAAARFIPMIRRERVDVLIALTHLTYEEDRELAEKFPEIDLIIGGHEHYPIASTTNRTFISKAGSDAKFVARIDIAKRRPGVIERFYELIPITAALADEPKTAEVVNAFESKLSAGLNEVVATTAVTLEGSAIRLRSSETNLGNLVADAVRAAARSELSLVNSGGIRGDRAHQPGPLIRRTLIEIHPFGNVVTTLSLPGRVVIAALEHGMSRLPAAAGQFPQVSGMTLRVKPDNRPGARVSDVRVQGAPLDPNRTYTMAIPDFLLAGGDGYTMFKGQKIMVGPESGPLMATALENYVAERRDVSPAVEGRIVIE